MRLGRSAACANGGGWARQGRSEGKLLPKLLPVGTWSAVSPSDAGGLFEWRAKLWHMERGGPQRAWLLMAAGDNRGHGGNAGYDDMVDAYYSWDSNVPNHKKLRVGDPIALWDKDRLLGVSVIEEIETSAGQKLLSRCPECATTRISDRKGSEPRYRCMKRHHEFGTPVPDVVEVLEYRARYDAAWTSLEGVLVRGPVGVKRGRLSCRRCPSRPRGSRWTRPRSPGATPS